MSSLSIMMGARLWGPDGLLAQAAAMLNATAGGESRTGDVETFIDSPYGRVPSYVRESPMIKFVALASRHPELSTAEFHSRWLGVHGPLTRSLQASLRIQRYVQCHVVESPTIDGFAKGRSGGGNPYDGFAEVWFRSEADLAAAFASPEGRKASAILAEDERHFCADPLVVFVTREYELVRMPEYPG